MGWICVGWLNMDFIIFVRTEAGGFKEMMMILLRYDDIEIW